MKGTHFIKENVHGMQISLMKSTNFKKKEKKRIQFKG